MKLKKGFFVTGTDTGVGKTLVSLSLCLYFKASYWKPIQTGQPSDTDFIRQFLPDDKIHPSAYALKAPLSPNQAAEEENIKINLKKISIPQNPFLIAEGIGGVCVPLNNEDNVMDLMKLVGLPLIVVARSGLGTLNHSLLTLEALKARNFKIAGVILSGPRNDVNKRDIEKWSGIPVLLEIPLLSRITKKNLLDLYVGNADRFFKKYSALNYIRLDNSKKRKVKIL